MTRYKHGWASSRTKVRGDIDLTQMLFLSAKTLEVAAETVTHAESYLEEMTKKITIMDAFASLVDVRSIVEAGEELGPRKALGAAFGEACAWIGSSMANFASQEDLPQGEQLELKLAKRS